MRSLRLFEPHRAGSRFPAPQPLSAAGGEEFSSGFRERVHAALRTSKTASGSPAAGCKERSSRSGDGVHEAVRAPQAAPAPPQPGLGRVRLPFQRSEFTGGAF